MEYLILFIIIFSQSVGSIFIKQYNIKTGNRSAYVYGGCMMLSAAVFFLVTSQGLIFTTDFLGYSLGFGVSYAAAIIGTNLSFRHGSIALTTLVTSLALMIPTMYGIVCLGEPVGIWLVLGIVMLVLSLCLINLKKDDKKISSKWVIFAGIAFVGNGMCSTIQKMEQVAFEGAYKNEFMIVALLMVSVIVFILSFITEKTEIIYCIKKGGIYTILAGFCNGLVNLLVMVLGSMMPTSIMFPLISALGIIGSFGVGRFVFKEKLNTMQLAGLLAGIISIVFFNL